MKPLALGEKTIPKKDVAAGIGTSLLVHVLIFSSAFFWALLMPHKSLNPPYCSVDLVSMKDIGSGSSDPKGNPDAAEKQVSARNVRHRGRVLRKSGPVVPITRLAVNETVRNQETHIEKIQPKDIPVAPEKPQGLESIEKNLNKLVERPKVTPRSSPESTQRPKSPARPVRSSSFAENRPGSVVTRGTPAGAAHGGREGTGQGNAFGTPYGSAAINQIAGMYGEQVRQKIESEWRLVNDQGIEGLKAVVSVQIKRTGEIVSIMLMKKSGNEIFDQAAVQAVNRAAPLPPVPEAIAQGSTQLILTFMPGHVSG